MILVKIAADITNEPNVLNLLSGNTAFVRYSDIDEIKADFQFETTDKYYEWCKLNVVDFGKPVGAVEDIT